MAFEVVCPTCSAGVRAASGRGGAAARCPACRAGAARTEESVRGRAVRRDEDDDEPRRPRRKRPRRKRRGSNSAIVLGACLAVGGLFLVATVAAFLLVKGGASGPATYPNLTPEQFNGAVKHGMTEEQAVAALGPPTRRRPVAVRYERGGVMGGWTEPVKTDRIRLTWVIHESGNSWSSCWADLDRDGGKIVGTGSGSGSSN